MWVLVTVSSACEAQFFLKLLGFFLRVGESRWGLAV